MDLVEYKKKRDFRKTPEPAPRKSQSKGTGIFVVQKHEATTTHFDFRLEADGVLKSWAVPKGPSMNPDDKRLALRVEDHPLRYAKFEGVIPEGQYGAGKVEIWDSGTWEPTERFSDVDAALSEGLIEFRLKGKRLRGNFILVEMEYSTAKNGWLLIKREDGDAVYEPYDAMGIR